MALLFCDSFDHYETADLIRKWTAASFGTLSLQQADEEQPVGERLAGRL